MGWSMSGYMSLDEWLVCMDDWIDVWIGGWDGE